MSDAMRSMRSLLLSPAYQRFVERFPPVAEPEPATAPDGLAWCDTCRGYRLLRLDVPIDHPDFGRPIVCPSCPPEVGAARTQRRLARLWEDVPMHFRGFTLDSFPGDRRLVQVARDWLPGDRWLYLHGPVGRGKSGLAIAVLRALVEGGQSGLFVVVPDMLGRIRETYHSREAADADERTVMASLYEVGVLVLDDLGAERRSDWVEERLFMVIGHRHDHQKRTVITSNMDLAQLAGHLEHKRTASRIEELADVVQVTGAYLRTGAA